MEEEPPPSAAAANARVELLIKKSTGKVSGRIIQLDRVNGKRTN